MNVGTWFIAFFAMVFLDISWVLYMRAAGKNNPTSAAFWAAVLHGFGAISILAYVDDHRYLTATMAGTIIGTWLVVAWTRRRDKIIADKKSDPKEE